ncbi:MAG TPA: FecR domain-containing protein [Chthoniobacterales bacterium]|nr:FecR domain-containing protein [Chthoniobacterales bacterium]
MRGKTFLILAAVPLLSSNWSSGAPLTEARVTKIINEVKLVDPNAGDHDAKLNDVVRDEFALTTGIKSRSELLFQDNTLTRLGPESYFSFKGGTREMTLQKGTMLLQVPKGLGGAKIHTASVTAAITGTTIMMEYVPQKAIKVLVLEGTMRLSMNGRFGDSLLLTPGKMVIMSPNARRVPDPVTVDLKKIVQTSTLVNMHSKPSKTARADAAPLPSMSKIEKAVDQQQSGKNTHNLIDTNLVILGKGTNVVLGSDQLIADLTARNDVAKANIIPVPLPVITPAPTPGPTPIPAPTPNSNPSPSGTPAPPPPGVYLTNNTTTIATQPSSATITTQGVAYSGVIYKDLPTNGSPSGFLFAGPSAFDNEFDFDNFYAKQFSHSAVFTFDSLQLGGGLTFNLGGEIHNVALVGNTGIINSAATTLNLSGVNRILFATQAGDINLDSGISFRTNAGDKPNLVQFYARGGDLNIGSNFTLSNSTLHFAAENNALFNSNASVTAKSLIVTGLQTAEFDGTANVSSTFQLSGGTVTVGGSVTAKDTFLFGTAATINGSLGGGDLTATFSGDFLLAAAGSLTGSGKLEIDAGGIVQFDGIINAPNADVVVSGVAPLPNTPGIIVNNNLTAHSFDFELGGDFLLNAPASLTSSGDLKINAGTGTITLDGAIVAGDATLTANGDVSVNQSLSADHLTISSQNETITAAVTAHDADFNPTGDFNLLSPGSLNLTGHLKISSGQNFTFDGAVITAHDVDLNSSADTTLTANGSLTLSGHLHVDAGGNIDFAGPVSASHDVQLTAGNNVLINGSLQASSANITASTLTINGSINAPTVNLQLSSGLNAGAAGSLISAQSVSITVPTPFTFNVTNGTTTQFDLTSLKSLTIQAQDITFNGDLSLSSPNGDLTATNGDIVATGHTLNGFDQITANNGNVTADSLSAKKVSVGGTLAGDSITADTITTNALHADTVTANKSLTVNSSDLAPYSTGTITINASSLTLAAGANLNGTDGTPFLAPTNAFNLAITTGNFTLGSTISLNGGDADPTVTDAGGNGGQLDLTGNSLIINAPISATSGLNSNSGLTGGAGGTVNLTAQNTVTVNNKIEVSSADGNRRHSASGGHINIKSNANGGTAINITSSAQLLALLDAAAPGPGGSIKLTAAGGNINMSGTAQADRGTIEITNNGTSGAVNLANATLAADTIKVGALGTNGTLNIGGGTIAADTLIKLYAGGSNGTVDFVNNVTLSGNSAKVIAANTVIINNGKTVTILGPSAADVFTNNPHYTGFGGDSTTTGTFAGKGAATHPLSGAPGY